MKRTVLGASIAQTMNFYVIRSFSFLFDNLKQLNLENVDSEKKTANKINKDFLSTQLNNSDGFQIENETVMI